MMVEEKQQEEIPSALQQELERSLYERADRIRPEDEQWVDQRLEEKVKSLLSTSALLSQKLRVLVHRVQLLYAMLKDPEFSLRWSTKAIILAALVYFINPFDIVPDVLPLIGYIDDAFVLGLVLSKLQEEIQRYATFRHIPLEVAA